MQYTDPSIVHILHFLCRFVRQLLCAGDLFQFILIDPRIILIVCGGGPGIIPPM